MWIGMFSDSLLTLLHGSQQVVIVLCGVVISALSLHALVCTEQLRVLAVAHEGLIVLLQVFQSQTVILHLQSLELMEWK